MIRKRGKARRGGCLALAAAMTLNVMPAWQVEAQEEKALYEPTWESLEQAETAPEWFQDAKFGIYFHWGAFTTPEYGDEWYGNKMAGDFRSHHESTYGSIADWPYHNFITGAEDLEGKWVQFSPKLKSEGGAFDPEEWAQLFADAGARFAGPVMEHHDGFSMWDSDVTPWNSVDLGPKLDLAGLFVDAIRDQDMKVLSAMHHAFNVTGEFFNWVDPYKPWEKSVPGMTEEDIKKLYGRFESEEERDAFWLAKLKEVIDKYDPDIIWQDFRLEEISEEARLEFLSYFYNKDVRDGGDGVVATYKYNSEYNDGFTEESAVPDYERGGPGGLKDFYWLTDDTVSATTWGYTEGMQYYSAKSLLHALADRISKNGNLLLNISPRADGSIPQEQKDILLEMGEWLDKYGEAVYSTRAWSVYGEGPTLMGGGSYQTPREGGEADIRFTRSKDKTTLYAIGMQWPEDGVMDIKTLKEGVLDAGTIQGIYMADGSEALQALEYEQDQEGLHITLPASADDVDDNGYAVKLVFEDEIPSVSGVTFYQDENFKGAAMTLVPGEYDESALRAAGIPIDDVSSIQVPEGYSVYGYDGGNFDNACWIFEKDLSDLKGANNAMASVKIVKNEDPLEEVVPEEGKTYKIVLRKDPEYVLEYAGAAANDANVQVGVEEQSARNQEWMLIPVEGEEGCYRISPVSNPNMCIDIYWGWYENGRNLVLYEYTGASNQQWKLESTGSGYYSIHSQGDSSYCIDEADVTPGDGSNVQLWKYEFGDRQQWRLQEMEEESHTPVLKVSFDGENANDESGYGSNGTVAGEPEYVQGVSGKAIHLVNPEDRTETATQYVNFGQPENLQFGTGSFTLMFWYKAEGLENNSQEGSVISNKNWESGDNPGFNIGHMEQGLNLNFNTTGDGKDRAETDRFSGATDGEWHHVAAVVDRETNKQIALYLDGKAAFGGSGGFGSRTYTDDISAYEQTVDVTDFVLGADGEKRHGVEDAYIDELKVYKDAVSLNFIQRVIADDRIGLEVAQMEEMIGQAEPGCRFSEEAITDIKEKIALAKEQLAQADSQEREAIIEELRESYEIFLNGNEPNTVFHLISDMHVTDTAGTAAKNLAAGLEDMKEINPQASALISVGDNTQNGTQSEVEAFYQVLKEHHPLENGKTLIALGNHDVRGPGSWEDWPEGDGSYWSTAYSLYMEHNGQYMPETNGKTYFDYWADGYHLIVLNSENSAKDMAYLTDEQIAWLDEKLSEQEDPARPAIVIVHQALQETHWGSHWYNGFGPKDEAVKEVLQKHPQTIVISGHIHNGFGVAEAIDRPYGTMIDVPAFVGSNRGLADAGTGYEVYVYDDEILFRARNFVTSAWLPQYDLSVKLKSLPKLTAEAKALSQEDYTQESWNDVSQRLETAIGQADELMNRKYGTETPAQWLYHRDTREKIEDLQEEFTAIFGLLTEKPDSELTLEEAIQKAEEAQAKAEAAQAEAEIAQEEARKAQTEAEAAKTAAETARMEAEAAKQAAQEAVAQAGADSAAAQAAMQEAVKKAQEAADAQADAEAAKEAAETAKADAVKAKEEAESLLAAAKTLAEQAELKAAEAEAAKKEAEAERLAAEAAKKEAEAERLKAEEAKKEAEAERRKAEEARKAAEAAKAEALKIKAELEKLRQEAAQGSAENADNEREETAQKAGKASLKSVKRQSKGRLKVTWKKVAGATGYEITYSRNAKFKNAVTKKASAKKTSLVLKKLKSKKTYYVKVRAVKKTESGTVYGDYSKVTRIKTK